MLISFISVLYNEDGSTLAEYSLIVGLIAVACVFALQNLSSQTNNLLNFASTKF
jgi:Flp pilus assembly pilin Flp